MQSFFCTITLSIPAVPRRQSQRSESVCPVRLSRKAAATNSAPGVPTTGDLVMWMLSSCSFMFKRYQKHWEKTTWLYLIDEADSQRLEHTSTKFSDFYFQDWRTIQRTPRQFLTCLCSLSLSGPQYVPLLRLSMSLRLPPLWFQQRMQLVCPAADVLITVRAHTFCWFHTATVMNFLFNLGFPIDMSAYRRDARSSSSDQCQY